MLTRFLAVLGCLVAAAGPARADLLAEVTERGYLRCGINEMGPGMATIGAKGVWSGFYPDICHAVAAAVTGDARDVEFTSVSTGDRFDAVRAGAVDLLAEPSTWTLGRDTSGIDFPVMYMMDGQGLLVRRDSGIETLADLGDGTVCVYKGVTSLPNLEEERATRGLDFEIRTFATLESSFMALYDGMCDAISTDTLIMGSVLQATAPDPDAYVIPDQRLSKEPLSPVVKAGNPEWTEAVRWVVHALIAAEELGVTADNAADLAETSENAAVRRLLGAEGDFGERLGLDKAWALRAIQAVGNYGELYARTLTAEMGLARGRNALHDEGGLLWAPPIR